MTSDALDVPSYREMIEDEIAGWLRNDHLHLIILPTERCNFRCTYCYEDFSIGRMTPTTVTAVKRLIDHRVGELSSLYVSWFGGEPLLAVDVIEEIASHIVQRRREWPELHYAADMTTNAFLLDPPMVEKLVSLGITLFQISLDGPETLHNRTRIRADGQGSFRRIWHNLLAIRDGTAGVNVILRVHLTPENLAAMPAFLEHVRETFLGDARFKVLLKPVEHLGGPNDATMDVIPQRDRESLLERLEAIVLAGAREAIYPAPRVCYASRPNSLVIRADSTIAKCTVAFADPANTIGRLLPEGSLQIDPRLLRPWLRGWSSGDWQTLECPYSGMAPSEPRLLQIRRGHDGREPSEGTLAQPASEAPVY